MIMYCKAIECLPFFFSFFFFFFLLLLFVCVCVLRVFIILILISPPTSLNCHSPSAKQFPPPQMASGVETMLCPRCEAHCFTFTTFEEGNVSVLWKQHKLFMLQQCLEGPLQIGLRLLLTPCVHVNKT